MVRWMMEQMTAASGVDVPVFLEQRNDEDPQDLGGIVGTRVSHLFHHYGSKISFDMDAWGPSHGNFQFCHPWTNYLKIGMSSRMCAYCIETLSSCLDSKNDQVPEPIKKHLESGCMNLCTSSSNLIRELVIVVRTMTRSRKINMAVEDMKNAVLELQNDLKIISRFADPTTRQKEGGFEWILVLESVAEPLRAMVMGAPLEYATHLAQRYDSMRQDAEAQVIEVSKRQAKVTDGSGNPYLFSRLEAAETKLQDLKSNMARSKRLQGNQGNNGIRATGEDKFHQLKHQSGKGNQEGLFKAMEGHERNNSWVFRSKSRREEVSDEGDLKKVELEENSIKKENHKQGFDVC
ncbi:hypothetical protein E3N88_18472 [Mikania micrantha]|uniref:Uncharacterized protein n=1 Tax=Mikania micrantha TaxID=192012 RepID=A0A5N6NKI2_9ASTR|nr:hypothetical protein E3N88_18472 [Mikania micrantha]